MAKGCICTDIIYLLARSLFVIFPESWRLEGYITNKIPNIIVITHLAGSNVRARVTSALRSRNRYCIARARHSKTHKASSVCYNDFSAVTDLQPMCNRTGQG